MKFEIEAKLKNTLARAGRIATLHGVIETPAFIVVGTNATAKALTCAQLREIGVSAVLSNTYHLYLEPGYDVVRMAGGLGKFMNWSGPTLTDSGGFQVFSLGAAWGRSINKLGSFTPKYKFGSETPKLDPKLAKIDEDGVTFKSFKDGSTHRFTPEFSIKVQHDLGADIIFSFDECTAPDADYNYQKDALARTTRWARRGLEYHLKNRSSDQAIFGIAQGGRHENLRKESASQIASMPFDGFGIGGSFEKEDVGHAVRWVNEILPEDKPRHLLGIGEPEDLFLAILNGADMFDCVSPTRLGRNGTLYTEYGKINITNAQFIADFSVLEANCDCYTCKNFTKAYLSHLFRAKEMLGCTLASIHNVYFLVSLVKKIRKSILDNTFLSIKDEFQNKYKKYASAFL